MVAVIGGIIALIVGIILLFGGKIIPGLPVYLWNDFLVCLKGLISSGLVIGGLLAIISGIEKNKDKIKARDNEGGEKE